MKIHPFLWFDTQAEEAANFYTSVFENSRVLSVSHYGDAVPDRAGTVMTVSFELAGLQVTALNAGPQFKFSEAFSFYVDCEDQEEVDELWAKLTDGGEESQCGWLKDKFGFSWQIIPRSLTEMLQDSDPERANRVMEAMLKMGKIETSELDAAYNG